MSFRVDFFEGLKNLHPPHQTRKRYDRNYSGTGSDNDSINPGMHIRRNTNENFPNSHSGNLPKDYPPPSMTLKHITDPNFNKIPNEPFLSSTQPTPFSYNEVHPRTSAHLHRCPSCDYPVVVQVTADLNYHHVSFIPGGIARTNEAHKVNNFVVESQLSSRDITQKHSPVQELDEVSALSNNLEGPEPVEEEEEEGEEMMETAPNEEPQGLSVTKLFRTYASITAGEIDIKEDDNNPLEKTEETNDDSHQVQVESPKENTADMKPEENAAASQAIDNGGDGDDDASDDGFIIVVSSKTKSKAKAAAKAKEVAARGRGHGRWRNTKYGKHERISIREEHNKNGREPTDDRARHARMMGTNDGEQRGEHDNRSRGGLINKQGRKWPKDGHDKHEQGNPREYRHDKHEPGNSREYRHDKHETGNQRPRGH